MAINFDRIIDNKKISEDELKDANISADKMKQIIKDTMGKISNAMSTKNFMRWMKSRDVSKSLRKLIVRVCNEENDEHLKNHPLSLGYASSIIPEPLYGNAEYTAHLTKGYNVQVDKKITLREGINESEHVASHEFLHMISYSGKMRFTDFLNEGLTQYITEIIMDSKQKNSGYRYNVAIVERLHNILGDKLIKAYFIGNPLEVEKDISILLGKKM